MKICGLHLQRPTVITHEDITPTFFKKKIAHLPIVEITSIRSLAKKRYWVIRSIDYR